MIGCGPIGLFTTLRLNALGADVLSVDRMQSRVEMARRFGASAAQLAPSDRLWSSPEQREAVAAWTGGEGPAVVIEAAGVPGSLEAALDVVANDGRVVCVGISNQVAQLSMRTPPYKEIDLLGSRNSLRLIPDALKLIEQFPELTRSLITHRFPLRELDAALRLTASGTEGIGKIAIDVSQPGER